MKESANSIPAGLMILTGIGILLFWAAFFTIDLAPADAPACYLVFERAFPVPDSLLALGLIAGGLLTLRNRPAGSRLARVCAGGLLFLGVIDIAFNLQNGIYALGRAELAGNAAINLWCLGLGLLLAVRPK